MSCLWGSRDTNPMQLAQWLTAIPVPYRLLPNCIYLTFKTFLNNKAKTKIAKDLYKA